MQMNKFIYFLEREQTPKQFVKYFMHKNLILIPMEYDKSNCCFLVLTKKTRILNTTQYGT
jgi:hypothetical protein